LGSAGREWEAPIGGGGMMVSLCVVVVAWFVVGIDVDTDDAVVVLLRSGEKMKDSNIPGLKGSSLEVTSIGLKACI
jgi:hypothetical protein